MNTTAPTTNTTSTPAATEPPITLHVMNQNDILRAQVYGIPAIALCGFEFVPMSGHPTSNGSGNGKSVICEPCRVLRELGFRTPPPRD